MKDGTTHLAYKAEQTVDLKAPTRCQLKSIMPIEATRRRSRTRCKSRGESPESGSTVCIRDVVADKGYHSAETITTFAEETSYRTYIPEPRQPVGQTRIWTDKPPEQRDAVYANRRRTRGRRGSDCNDCATSRSSDHLLMCARPAEHDGHGSAASQKLASGT